MYKITVVVEVVVVVVVIAVIVRCFEDLIHPANIDHLVSCHLTFRNKKTEIHRIFLKMVFTSTLGCLLLYTIAEDFSKNHIEAA